MPASLEEWIERYRTAWEERDADAAAALFAPDSTYRSNIFEEPVVGADGVRAYWTGVTATQSEVEVKMGRPFTDGQRVAVEFWTNMKNSGSDVTLPGCLLLDFGDDWMCTRLREYWSLEMSRKNPPPEWGT